MNKIGRPPKNRVAITVTLPKAIADRLRQDRDKEGVNISHVIEKALTSYWGAKNGNKD